MQIASYESGGVRLSTRANKGAVVTPIEPFRTCLQACSACSGDYEDPERTAFRDSAAEEADDEESGANLRRSVDREEFPVREE
ncbi:MAG: hypothetical protein JWO71_646 [Candidatus Acidoferrum typicum]|nr:hypothetical protein [Candidatus Acidoferrum typicum]